MSEPIWIPGRPAKKGSVRPILSKRGKVYLKPQDAKLVPWTGRCAALALAAGWKVTHGPVVLKLVAYYERPKGHYRGKARTLREDAPVRPTSQACGDIDKVSRAALDSLSRGIAYHDDSQVARLEATKRWKDEGARDEEGVELSVRPTEDARCECGAVYDDHTEGGADGILVCRLFVAKEET